MTKTNDTSVREYVNEATGETAGAFVGSAMEEAFESNADWKLADGHAAADTADQTDVIDPDNHSRDELNELAKEAGVEGAEAMPNKPAVADAINAARGGE